MIDPSGIKLPAGVDFIIDEVKTGEFVVQNAYDGEYEYFTGRPMKIRVEAGSRFEKDMTIDQKFADSR